MDGTLDFAERIDVIEPCTPIRIRIMRDIVDLILPTPEFN